MHTLLLLAQLADTIRLAPAPGPIAFDGRVTEQEYGPPTVAVPRPAGAIRLWMRRDEAGVYIAAAIPDATFYWGDDVVVSLDTAGDRAPGPMHDDFQWYFRRVLDSSVVFRGDAGKWRAPRDDPDWRLGAEREGGGWAVRSASDSAGWSLELRLDPGYFEAARGALPGITVRVYDDDPHGWFAWPRPAGIKHPAEVEHRPALWVPVLGAGGGS
jgi:hypothetical protein